MTSDESVMARGERVIAALQVLDTEGAAGFAAARQVNPKFAQHLCNKVVSFLRPEAAILHDVEIRGISPPAEYLPKSAPEEKLAEPVARKERGIPSTIIRAAGMRRKSVTKELTEELGSRAVTRMTHFVILQHLSIQLREASVSTIFEELIEAKLMGKDQRGSLVTSLNRLKKEKDFITWPAGGRGEEITLTDPGKNYLRELKEKKLQPPELDFLKKNVPVSIRENLP